MSERSRRSRTQHHALFYRAERAQRLVPPGAHHALGLDVLLLVMRAALFALVERVLHADVRLDLPLCRLQADEARYPERVSDLDLCARTHARGEKPGGRIVAAQMGKEGPDPRRTARPHTGKREER